MATKLRIQRAAKQEEKMLLRLEEVRTQNLRAAHAQGAPRGLQKGAKTHGEQI